MKRICAVFGLILFVAGSAWSADGLVRVKSAHPPAETLDRLEKLVKEKGLTVFVRVDHAAGAAKVGKTLRPTQLLIFGNPQGGTPSWLGYNDPQWIARRHEAPKCAAAANLKKALAAFAGAAAK